MIRIYSFSAPSRALRPIWLCEEMGLPYQVELVSFPSGADYRARHALGSVPFLEDDGGVAIGESIAMLFYLAGRYGPTPLLPAPSDPQFARVLALTVFSEATFGAALSPLLVDKFLAPEGAKASGWAAQHTETRCSEILAYVEAMLGRDPFLAGERFTIADIAMNVSLGMWAMGLGRSVPETLARYQARLATRPALTRAMAQVQGGLRARA